MTLDTSVSPSRFGRLTRNQTAIDFHRHRRIGLVTAAVIVVVTVLSLLFQGLNLGLDFRGGDAWEVPVTETFGVAEATAVLQRNGVDTGNARIQIRSTETAQVVTVQTEVLPRETADAITSEFAETAGIDRIDISFSFTSSTWGREITEKAGRALVVFVALVVVFLSIRLEWRMAVAAIAAMLYDVVFAVGFYSLFQFRVAPATVIAFLTILGYSLYDTIVVFDKVKDNTARFAGSRVPYADVVNVSMNQVMMRSLNTSISSLLPVVSLIIVGARFMGAIALQEFALALFVGLIAGAYSSLFIASPVLALLKEREPRYRSLRGTHLTGEAMLELSVHGAGSIRREHARTAAEPAAGGARIAATTGDAAVDATTVLTHPPRPRKKRRR
jgi:preprotein translocase subunit SecF